MEHVHLPGEGPENDITAAVNAAIRKAEQCPTTEQRKELFNKIDNVLTVSRFRLEDAQDGYTPSIFDPDW